MWGADADTGAGANAHSGGGPGAWTKAEAEAVATTAMEAGLGSREGTGDVCHEMLWAWLLAHRLFWGKPQQAPGIGRTLILCCHCKAGYKGPKLARLFDIRRK